MQLAEILLRHAPHSALRGEGRSIVRYGLHWGVLSPYIGQEAVVVGMAAAREGVDTVITSYRDHGHMLACGMDAKGVMAELTDVAVDIPVGKGIHAYVPRGKGVLWRAWYRRCPNSAWDGFAFAHRYAEDGGGTLRTWGTVR